MKILARWRVTLGFIFGAAVLWLAKPTAQTLIVGSLVACVGEALRFWAAGHLNKSREITSSGPYRWLAHPLYVGSSVMGAGLALASASLVAAALIAIYLGATLTAAVKSEEAFLRQTFGDEYDRYRHRAATISRSSAGGDRQFSWARALANGEHRAAIGLVAAMLLLFFRATYNGFLWRVGG